MANYVLKKKQDFTFAREENPDKVYTLPAFVDLGVDDFTKYFRTSYANEAEKLKVCKEFIIGCVPELAGENISDMEYVFIFNAYASQQGLGER